MGHILGLKFRDHGQVYYFDSGAFVVNEGDRVIVNTEQGMGLGQVVLIRDEAPVDVAKEDLKSIYRLATEEDMAKMAENDTLAKEAFEHCRSCIKEHDLEMKLVDVEVFFDKSKVIFYFTAPNRIDFRELVKDLVRAYRTRIELRQIGVRHETQMVGAVGNCGQVCCCRRFLRKFAPVTIKMAKEQNLFLNPTKISGICGRLLCCLSYEQEHYENFRRQCPKIGKKYVTEIGNVKVLRANLFRKSLSLYVEGGEEQEVELDEWAAMNPRRPDPNQQQAQPRQESDKPQARPRGRGKQPRPSGGKGKPEAETDKAQDKPAGKPRGKGPGRPPRDRKAGKRGESGQGRKEERTGAEQSPPEQKKQDTTNEAPESGVVSGVPSYDIQSLSAFMRDEPDEGAEQKKGGQEAKGGKSDSEVGPKSDDKARKESSEKKSEKPRRRRKRRSRRKPKSGKGGDSSDNSGASGASGDSDKGGQGQAG